MWRDAAWLLDMLNASRKALSYASGLTKAEFLASSRDQDATLRQLTIVGEAAKRVSAEFRGGHPEIPWKRIAGFRDVVVHDYFRADVQEVWRIVQEDLPALVAILEPLVPPEEGEQ
ncbi:MAG TPA: DUF86 domain-containing protein [Thermoleophilia bacterium]|nr:DUF86 domain-containing protein [Thermoleophilia bacterium]